MDNTKDKLCKLLDSEMEKIAAMPTLNDASLSNLYKLVDVKKDLYEIEEKKMIVDEGYGDNGNSYGRYMNGNSNRYPMNPPIYYGESYNGNSYQMNNGGYSRDRNSDSYTHLEEAMRSATSEAERDAIRQVMNKMYR